MTLICPASAVDRFTAAVSAVAEVLLTGAMTRASTAARLISVSLDLPMPYDAESLLGFLGQRTVVGVESLDGMTYARTLRLAGGPAAIRMEVGDQTVAVRLWLSDPADVHSAVQRCRWLLDLDTDVAAAEAHLAKEPRMALSIAAHPGLRVPGHVDGFEVTVRAVVGQQISVAGARTILGRLVTSYGEDLPDNLVDVDHGLTRLFPRPERMGQVDPETLPMPRSRGRALVRLARAVTAGDVILDRGTDLAGTRRDLLALPGVGPWTADYIALRALGDPDVFMSSDLGVRHGLGRMGLTEAGPDLLAAWSPWRSYALMHVWKQLDQEVA
jgi:AraC family transcriptional regulator of adaptative response / DNA-3-methyladenine glycosylase II